MIDKKQNELNRNVIDYIKKYDIDIFNVENHLQEFMFGYSTIRIRHIDTGFRTVTLKLKPKKESEEKMKKTATKKVKKVTKTSKKK